jgi:hypothetical protein
VNLNNTGEAKITFELERGGVLYGTVKDDAGQPIADAGVSITPADHHGGAYEYMRTKTDGRYRFEHVPLSTSLELGSLKTDYLDDERQMSLAGSQDTEQQVDLVLHYTLAIAAYKRWPRNVEDTPIAIVVRLEELGRTIPIYARVKAAVEVEV